MARPRASGTPRRAVAQSRGTARQDKKKNLATTTGMVGGGGLAAYAYKLTEPYGPILIVLAPTISVLLARFGPSILDFGTTLINHLVDWSKHKIDNAQLQKFLVDQRKELQQPDMTPERRAVIERRVAEVKAEIDDREYRRITPLLMGDSQSGLAKTEVSGEPSPSTPGETPDG